MHALLVVWTVTGNDEQCGPATSSKLATFSHTRTRAQVVLEKMFKSQPAAVLGSCIRIWAVASEEIDDTALFNAVDVLTPSAQRVVEMVGEVFKRDHT